MRTKYATLSRGELLQEIRWQIDHREHVDKELLVEIAERLGEQK